MANPNMVKVRLHGSAARDVETLWAMPIDVNLYQLDNSFFLHMAFPGKT
jgi:hypothetical protein